MKASRWCAKVFCFIFYPVAGSFPAARAGAGHGFAAAGNRRGPALRAGLGADGGRGGFTGKQPG